MCNFTHFLNEKMIANILTGSRIILSLILLKCNGIIFWILYTICGHATAELIYSRANSDKEHMGLTNWDAFERTVRMMHEQTNENLDMLSKMNKQKDKIEEKIREKKKIFGMSLVSKKG